MNHSNMIKDFKIRFIVSLIVTIPILVLSPTIQGWFNFSFEFTGDAYILFALATFIFIYGGWPFIKGLYNELKNKQPGMMTLIALAITVAYSYSTAVTFGLDGSDFFWELATLIVIMLLGHYVEMKSVANASNALEELAALMPDEAHLVDGDNIKEIPIKEIEKDNILLVKAGEKIPADAVIIKGSTYINESMLTGESEPVKKGLDDKVIGGSINSDNSIRIKVSKTDEDSYLSKVINLVNDAQESKSRTQNLADKAAFWLTIIALTAGFTTLIIWYLINGDISYSISRMATVMVITCPHALGLAMPLVVARSTAISAQNGLLIRNRTQFEKARETDVIVFDKTGTLTKGNFGVNFIKVINDNYTKEDIIKYAASIEQSSEHPIARGIMSKSKDFELDLYKVNDFNVVKGQGVKGKINGDDIAVMSPKYLKENDINVNVDIEEHDLSTNVYLLKNNNLIAIIGLFDEIREDSLEAVKSLKEMGIKTWMITGDNEKTAKEVANKLDLDGYYAEVMPEEKQEHIIELQKDGSSVMMTGDGINDAPALAKADTGVAIGSGTDVAAETADIILVKSRPSDIVTLIKFSRKTYKKMIQNLIWATAYNVIAIPLAAGVLAGIGFIISPAVGAIFMSLSTIIVAINAKLLKLN